MLINYIRFITFWVLIMVVTHVGLYLSWVYIFSISSVYMRLLIGISLGFLSISVLLASQCMRHFYTPVTRFYYAVSTLWYGLMIYLLFATFAIFMFKAFIFVLPIEIPKRYDNALIIGLYGLAVIYLIVNHAHIYRLKITRLTVPIKNLPPSWNQKILIQISDMHLGAFRAHKYLKVIIRKVNELKPDIIAITGDLFDGSSSRHQSYTNDLSGFQAAKGVYFVSGNHEVYAGYDSTLTAVKAAGIHVIDNQVRDIDGLQLIGVGYPRLGQGSKAFDFTSDPKFNPQAASILLFHTPTDIAPKQLNSTDTHSKSYLDPTTRFDTAIEAGIDLQLSGHTHAGQFFPMTWFTRRIYNGFHYGLHQIGNFHIYIHSGTGTWGPPMRSVCASEIVLIRLVGA